MKTSRKSIRAGLLLAPALAVAAFSPLASAQLVKKEVKVEAPTPGKEDADAPYIMNAGLLVAIFVLIIGVNCLPPKRGHQD